MKSQRDLVFFTAALLVTSLAALAQPAAKRTSGQVMAELQQAGQELQQAVSGLDVLLDPVKRAQYGPGAVGPLRKMLGAYEELAQIEPAMKKDILPARLQFMALLSLLGDQQATDLLARLAESSDAAEALAAKSTQLQVRWWQTNQDAAAQSKVLDDMTRLAKANPTSDALAHNLMVMSQQAAASKENRARAEAIVLHELKGPLASQVAQQIRDMQKLRELEGKPLTLSGTTVEGGSLNTADWKGQVVLVVFWAASSPPSVSETPRLKRVFGQYKDKGLRIVGVANDKNPAELTKFLEQNTDIAWPQLYEKTKPGWHALATEHNVNSIPTMILIDKKGLVRSVDARAELEVLVPKMVSE